MTTPDPESARLTPAGHLWRTALCVLVSGLAWYEVAGGQWSGARSLFLLDLAGGVVSFGLVFLRRRHPLGVAATTAFLGLFSASAAGPGALAFVSLATRRDVWQIVGVGVLGIVTGQLFYYYQPVAADDPPWVNFAFITTLTVAFAAIGMYLGSRRELIWTLRERARQAESTQALRVEQARSSERERIAREMHDVLAHRISLVAMHSGALAFREDLPPDQVRETAALIRAKSHEALTDLREVLGMLREEEAPHHPQPTMADLAELVDEAAQSGFHVDLEQTISGTPPEQVGRTVYRIVQEALTNARKHGAGTGAQVRVSGRPGDGIDLMVRNPLPLGAPAMGAPASGLGLIGLRERAELNGGHLSTSRTREAFLLEGWLPWPA